MSTMIRDWPQAERPREKLIQHGAASLSDSELLAIFLRTGVAGRSAVDLGRELVGRYGGLRGLFSAPAEQLMAERGLGPAKYAQLQAVLELARRHLAEQLAERDALNDPADAARYLSARLREQPREIFVVLFLDTRHRVIAVEELAHGTLDGASVYPREVLRRVMHHNAAAVILGHNHPSGVPEPSAADRRLTLRLAETLRLIDVRVLDHLIIGEGAPVSMAQRGLI